MSTSSKFDTRVLGRDTRVLGEYSDTVLYYKISYFNFDLTVGYQTVACRPQDCCTMFGFYSQTLAQVKKVNQTNVKL